jgi:F-type H+-transporting ATPase subunit a
MGSKMAKPLLVAVFSLFYLFVFAQGGQGSPGAEPKKTFDANEVIFGHIKDAHEFHFFSYRDKAGEVHHATIPLPVILYSPQKGWSVFMSSKFHHGHENYNGYGVITVEKLEEMGKENLAESKKYHVGQIVTVNEHGEIDKAAKVYDVSLTRNVVQMLIALALLVWIMLAIAKRYKKGQGVITAPKGGQGLLEPVIIFIKDEVAKPNLGHKYQKYLPYILTVFFFILINNIVGLIPGSANVTGNIAFTFVLAIISFVVILASSNKHYWSHIFWPPVPHWIKPILIPVEILGVFTKPFALMIRLFANMVAGHILIICLVSLIFIIGALSAYAGWGTSPFALGFTIFIYFIEILVAFLQAYIFANLSAVFIGQAFEGSHDDTDHHEDAVIV